MQPLTPGQKRVAERIRDSLRLRGYAPTMEELARDLGISKPTAQQYLRALEAKGAIRRRRYGHRAIEWAGPEEEAGRLPLAGRIAAGLPIEATQDIENVDIAETLGASQGRECFILQVKGDSMIEDGIFDGDYVVVERRHAAENGETVVALLPDNTATLKRFYREKNRIRLQPANAAMSPIYVQEVVIQGVVRGLFRRMAAPS